MHVNRRELVGITAAAMLPAWRTWAQDAPVIRIGHLSDMSGPYRDTGGPLSLQAVEQAVTEYAAAGGGFKIEVLSADHQNKADTGTGIARQWYDRDGVDMIIGIPGSAVALAVAGVTHEKNKVHLNTGSATSDLTGKQCNANTIHWVYDTWMLAHSTGGAAVRAGGDSWFFITADYAFGHALQRDTAGFVTGAGGTVRGSVAYPFPGTTDFSSFLVQARESGAKVIGFCNAGADAVNSIKQAREFGINQPLAGLLVTLDVVHALTPDAAQGLLLSETFYWDLNERTRAFSDRLKPRAPDKRPNMTQAGAYSATLHYLRAVADMGVAAAKLDGAATVARMKAMPTDDDVFGPGSIRADGRKLHPSYLFQVKTPAESRGPWDYYRLLSTTPAEQAFRPINEGGCPLIKA